MGTFKAVVVEKGEGGQSVGVRDFDENDLMEGDVTVARDAFDPQLQGRPRAHRQGARGAPLPDDPRHRLRGRGRSLLAPGLQAGRQGGAERLGHRARPISAATAKKSRVKGDWLIPLPEGLSPEQAMAIGTAGYTAMLAVLALEKHGLTPADGPAVVTGAAGGVGSVAIALLAKTGWRVIASTGRTQEADYLKGLGAAEIIDRNELSQPAKPLAKERWAAGVDSVGSHTLANLLAMTKYGGAIAACGLAGGMDLPTSVAPFILRGVALLGVDSVMAPKALRLEAWSRLAADLDHDKLAAMTTKIPLDRVIEAGRDILDGKVRGRTVVEIG